MGMKVWEGPKLFKLVIIIYVFTKLYVYCSNKISLTLLYNLIYDSYVLVSEWQQIQNKQLNIY